MANIVKLKTSTVCDVLEVSKHLNANLDVELVCEEIFDETNNPTVLICAERYYFRNSNYTGLTILLRGLGTYAEATVVGFGGGGGLMNMSYGANKSITKIVIKELEKFHFEVVESTNSTDWI